MRSTLKYDIMFPSSGGLISMKTKIIYISGNEVFNMADIHAAFEEVRSTLGLGSDTVMFGVPVDNDDALSHDNADNIETSVEESTVSLNVDSSTEDVDFTEVADEEVKPEQEPEVIAPVVPEEAEIKEKVVKKTTTKKSKSRAKEKTEPEMSAATDAEPVKNDEKIIPILSILAAKNEPETDTEESAVSLEEDEEESNIPEINVSTETVSVESVEKRPAHEIIADKITDEAPEEPIEKTLEQLLESMTPLREDTIEEQLDNEVVPEEETFLDSSDTTEDDTDATLEQLAAEFAENQDKIPTQPKTESHSKIGKLKNILPFKKAKRGDESGLMGDLFGWAGIAANDDDFAIPGFFSNAASKK